MSELGAEVVRSARHKVGARFMHHFKPRNVCDGGRNTIDLCMQRGMGPEGYDCSGLAIASICQVLAIRTSTWPRELRHTQQLATCGLVQDGPGTVGDVRLHYSANERIHLGIAVGDLEAIHASGVTGYVEEGHVTDKYGDFVAIRHIPLQPLCELAVPSA